MKKDSNLESFYFVLDFITFKNRVKIQSLLDFKFEFRLAFANKNLSKLVVFLIQLYKSPYNLISLALKVSYVNRIFSLPK